MGKFEDNIKDKFDQFEPQVDASVWNNVQNSMSNSSSAVSSTSNVLSKLVASTFKVAASIAVVSIAVLGVYQLNKSTQEEKVTSLKENNDSSVEVVKDDFKLINTELSSSDTEIEKKDSKELMIEDLASVNTIEEEEVKEESGSNFDSEAFFKELEEEQNSDINAKVLKESSDFSVVLNSDAANPETTWKVVETKEEFKGEEPLIKFDEEGSYTIEMTSVNDNGETITEDYVQQVEFDEPQLVIPNVFTPNNDGINDVYLLQVKNVKSLKMVVYDMNNNIVYETNKKYAIWNGTNLKGEPLEEGRYVNVVTYTDMDGNEQQEKVIVLLKK